MPRAADESSRAGGHRQQLRIGAFHVDAGALLVASSDSSTRLKPKAMGVLLALARAPGVTRTRDELLDEVWGSSHVTPGVVAHAVASLRRAFGDDAEQPGYIETIPRVGYRLIAPVRTLEPAEPAEPPAPDPGHAAGQPLPEPAAPATDAHAAAEASGANASGAAVAGLAGPAVPATADPGAAAPSGIASSPRAATRSERRWSRPAWLSVGAAAGLMLAVLVAAPWQGDAPPPPAALEAEPARRVTFGPGSEDHPRLNPGGDWVVYTRRDRLGDPPRLFLQSLHGTEALPLAGGQHAERPVWSPNGREIAYIWRSGDGSRCEIRTTAIDGAGHQTVAACPPRSVVYLDWNPVDPNQIAWSAIVPGSSAGTRVRMLRRTQGWAPEPFEYPHLEASTDLYPRFSPDGRRLAFRGGSNPTSDLYAVSSSGGEVTRLTSLRSEINGFDWLPDGSGLVFSSNHEGHRALYRLDIASGAIEPMGIDDATSPDVALHGGTLAFQLEAWRSALIERPLDGSPGAVLAPSSGRDFGLAMAADDGRLVFASDRDGSSQLWLLDRASGQASRLTRHPAGRVESPVLSADGRRVLYVLRVQGRHELHEFDLERRVGMRVAVPSASLRNAIYASDDRSLWYAAWQGADWRLHRCTRAQPGSTCTGEPTPLRAFRVERMRLDGRPVLLLAAAGTRSRVEVVSEDGLAPLDVPPLTVDEPWLPVDDAVWALRFQRDDEGMAVLESHSLADGRVVRLAGFRNLRHLLGGGFQVSADRRRIVLPVVTENRTDIGAARLAPAAR